MTRPCSERSTSATAKQSTCSSLENITLVKEWWSFLRISVASYLSQGKFWIIYCLLEEIITSKWLQSCLSLRNKLLAMTSWLDYALVIIHSTVPYRAVDTSLCFVSKWQLLISSSTPPIQHVEKLSIVVSNAGTAGDELRSFLYMERFHFYSPLL